MAPRILDANGAGERRISHLANATAFSAVLEVPARCRTAAP